MAPVAKKAKKENTEKDLETFLFGEDDQDLWEKTGNELNNDAVDDDEEEEADEVLVLVSCQ
jgi:hypothetical protein